MDAIMNFIGASPRLQLILPLAPSLLVGCFVGREIAKLGKLDGRQQKHSFISHSKVKVGTCAFKP